MSFEFLFLHIPTLLPEILSDVDQRSSRVCHRSSRVHHWSSRVCHRSSRVRHWSSRVRYQKLKSTLGRDTYKWNLAAYQIQCW
ncbi:hypothetical protein BT96DRAFT_178657 [Gymnopus androsaceus JB14]|uniref:Uncharacterized protein n=1 Tax=Gymnopus androsaceus JB14 TaxID=1447944 RepID=A0A6A4HAU8_9AGAR|nr:hypothetical protein BT96DRAFT_178657 [Gymnopus androsaceus JB14]